MITLYNSLKEWMNIPYERRVFVKNDAAGNKIYEDETIGGLCYPVGEVEQITDLRGTTVTSKGRIYIDGDVAIKAQDTIILEDEESPIITINPFYRDGKIDIKVVYL